MRKNSLAFLLMFFCVAAFAQNAQEPSAKISIEKLQKDIPQLMKQADIPGMSVAMIRNGKLVWNNVYGVMDAETKKPVTSQTVFEAASLSKCVFAYGVLN
jgi:CubicO group peptidase (beta-lactamase class C family)